MSISALVFILAFSYFLFSAFKKGPIYGVYAYMLAFYMHPQSKYWGASLPDLRWSLIAAVITLLAMFIRKEKILIFKYKETKLFALFVLFVVIQNAWAISGELQLDYTILVLKYLLLMIILQNVLINPKDFKGFVYVNIIGCGYIAYVAISTHTGGRFEGIGGAGIVSANQLSQHLIAIVTMASYMLLCNLGKAKLLLILLVAMTLKTIMMAESRSAMLALAITGLVSLFFIPNAVKKKFIGYAILGVIAGGIMIGPTIIHRFMNMQTDETGEIQDKSARSRLVIIKAQYEMFKDAPILGHGHKGTLLLSPDYIDIEYRKGNVSSANGLGYKASHNFLMSILVDHGVIGSVFYLLIIYTCLMRIFKLRKIKHTTVEQNDIAVIATGAIMGLFCFMVAGLGSNNKVLEVDIWIYIFVAVMMDWLQKQEDHEAKNDS